MDSYCSCDYVDNTFINSCIDNDLERVKASILLGASVNYKSHGGNWTALSHAANTNNKELCALLLEHPDIDVNLKEKNNWTPLMRACSNTQDTSEILNMLLAVPGIDLNCKNKYGSTAAMMILKHPKFECFKVLAENPSIDWNLQNKGGNSAVMMGAKNNRTEYLRVLGGKSGINWNLQNKQGNTAAMMAVGKECFSILAQVKGIQWNLQNNEGDTVAILAVKLNNQENIEKLSKRKNILWNIQNKDEETALTMALRRSQSEREQSQKFIQSPIIKILLSLPDIHLSLQHLESKNLALETIIHIKEFINEGRPGIDDKKRDTLLMYGIKNNFDNVVQFLIKADTMPQMPQAFVPDSSDANFLVKCHLVGSLQETTAFDFNVLDAEGNTPLTYCLKNKKTLLLESLISNPAVQFDIIDSNGDTPVMIALKLGMDDTVLKMLETSKGFHDKTVTLIRNISLMKGTPQFRNKEDGKLITCMNLNIKDGIGDTPLLYAMRNKKFEIVKQMVINEHVIDYTTDQHGNDFLHYQLESDNTDILKAMIDANLDMDWNMKHEANGYSWIMAALKKNSLEIFKVLSTIPSIDWMVTDENGATLDKVARSMKKKEFLDFIPGTAEFRIRRMEEERVKIPECPVCFETFTKASHVYHCSQGHYICGVCKPKIKDQLCPECRDPIVGRAFGFEKLLRN